MGHCPQRQSHEASYDFLYLVYDFSEGREDAHDVRRQDVQHQQQLGCGLREGVPGNTITVL